MGEPQESKKLRNKVRGLCAFAPLRETRSFVSPLVLCCLASAFSIVMLVGCIGYHVGTNSLYAADVATVYVPMIESDSYRRDLGERLTEAIVKEIELKTPYKVVSTPDADSI